MEKKLEGRFYPEKANGLINDDGSLNIVKVGDKFYLKGYEPEDDNDVQE